MDVVLNTLRSFFAEVGGNDSLFIIFVAAAGFALAMALSAFVSGLFDPIRGRLNQINAADADTVLLSQRLANSLKPMAAVVTPRKDRERQRIDRLLLQAGYRSISARTLFFGAKALAIVILPCLVLVASPLFPTVSTSRLMLYAVVAGYFGSVACSAWLDKAVERRQRAIRAGFPDALDLLVICVESGLGLAPALQRVADELTVSHPALGDELALVNAEIRAGVERGIALKNLADRTGLDDIRGLTALLVQTMRFGTSIADALRVYSEEFRDKRTQAAEEKAAKIGTKMIFPLVLFLFPSFFLVAIGPAVLALVDAFSQIGK